MAQKSVGRLEVIVGCAYSGKTNELARRVRRAEIAKQKVQVFKPDIDTRYDDGKVNSHSGVNFEAVAVDCPEAIFESLLPNVDVVGIDEIQFFDSAIVEVVMTMVATGVRVIVAGLNTDFRGEPFGSMPDLMARADKVKSLHAICVVCGDKAIMTQRIVNGRPARYDDPIVLVGAEEAYEARCREHHQVPRG